MVLALQVAGEMAGQGGSNYVGGLMSLAMVRELGPVMSALAVLAMAGSAYTAEITSMRQTQQLDAMSMLQVDPIRYLMLPRGVALACMLPMLTLLSTVLALWGGGWISETTAQIPPATYWDSVHQWTKLGDLGALLLKSVCFAVLIGALCCSVGFTNETNQEAVGNEVGNAVTKAVVWSFIAIAVADYGLSLLLFAQ
jgi:phospholipid/cholesterol/gamma-HCH transport system permease protein